MDLTITPAHSINKTPRRTTHCENLPSLRQLKSLGFLKHVRSFFSIYFICRAVHLWLELELGAQDAQLNLVCNFICTRSELQCILLLGLGSPSVHVLSLCTISNYCNYNALETVGSVGIAFHWYHVKSYNDIFRLISTLAIFNQVSKLMTEHFFLIKYTNTHSINSLEFLKYPTNLNLTKFLWIFNDWIQMQCTLYREYKEISSVRKWINKMFSKKSKWRRFYLGFFFSLTQPLSFEALSSCLNVQRVTAQKKIIKNWSHPNDITGDKLRWHEFQNKM